MASLDWTTKGREVRKGGVYRRGRGDEKGWEGREKGQENKRGGTGGGGEKEEHRRGTGDEKGWRGKRANFQ